jgi:hypothetical protein
MSAFNTFGGGPVQPSRVRARNIDLSGGDVTLRWPFINSNTQDIVAFTNRITDAAAGVTITMPPANQTSVGMDAIFRNLADEAVEILDADGDSIVTVTPGQAWYIWIVSNSSEAGEWDIVQFGAGASLNDAAALSGMGLKALNARLNQDVPVVAVVDDTLLNAESRSAVYVVDPAAGGGAFTFDPVATLTNGWLVEIVNLGASAWSLDPDGGETIDNQPSINLNPNESCFVHAGDSGFVTVGRGRTSQFAYTQNTQDVSGSSDVTLSVTQAGSYFQEYFGTLTGNINIIVPAVVQPYVVANNTTGAFTLTVKTQTGTGLLVEQGESVILHCNGTNVVDSDTIVPAASALAMPDGSVGAPGLAFASDLNLGFYRIGNDILGISANGQEVIRFSPTATDAKRLKMQGLDIAMWMAAIG